MKSLHQSYLSEINEFPESENILSWLQYIIGNQEKIFLLLLTNPDRFIMHLTLCAHKYY